MGVAPSFSVLSMVSDIREGEISRRVRVPLGSLNALVFLVVGDWWTYAPQNEQFWLLRYDMVVGCWHAGSGCGKIDVSCIQFNVSISILI